MPLQRITFNLSGKVKRKTFQGRKHVVVPAAILEEGVIEGSEGPLFYPAQDIARSVPSWNNRPLVIYHPEDEDGRKISAANTVVLETRAVGFTLNTKYDGKLRTEAWIDVDKCLAVDERVLDALEQGTKVECSTGLFTENEGVSGEHNGKKYTAIARNHQPDHLAILPDLVGAYSVEMGGGLLTVNQGRQPARTQNILNRTAQEALERVGFELVDNELTASGIQCQVSDLLAAKLGEPGKYWPGWICDLYPDSQYVIYSDRNGTWKIEYQVEKDTVSLKGEPVQVEREVSYVPVGNTAPGNPQKETVTMAFDKVKHVNSLIGNGGWDEIDREGLLAMPEAQLAKIKPTPTTNAQVVPATVAPVTQTPGTAGGQQEMSLDQYITNAPPQLRGPLADMVARDNAEREALVKGIIAYPQNTFVEADLRKAPIANLRAIHNMIPKQPVYQGGYSPLVGEGANPVQNTQFVDYTGAAGVMPVNNNAPPPVGGVPLPDMDCPALAAYKQ